MLFTTKKVVYIELNVTMSKVTYNGRVLPKWGIVSIKAPLKALLLNTVQILKLKIMSRRGAEKLKCKAYRDAKRREKNKKIKLVKHLKLNQNDLDAQKALKLVS